MLLFEEHPLDTSRSFRNDQGAPGWDGRLYHDIVGTYTIRVYGDPVLRQRASEVTAIDGRLASLVDDMVETMYAAPGVGLAATQIGIQKRLFIYDIGEGPVAVVNPVVSESRGEWSYDEGCLSVPGMSWPIVRPKEVHLQGYDLAGREISVDADELLARVFLHEVDHLDGILLVERLDDDQRKAALKVLRQRVLDKEEAGVAHGVDSKPRHAVAGEL
ncbi:MAG: peptide deformylase [Acidimicrobiales bacterium]